MDIALLLATGSAITIGGADFVGGLAARRMSAIAFTASAQTINLALLALMASVGGAASVTARDLLFGAAAGISGSLAFGVFLMAMARGPMSIVSPVTAVIGATSGAAIGMILGDRPSGFALLGSMLGVVAIALVASEGRGSRTVRLSTLALAIAAGFGFGAFVVFLDFPSPAAGLWPLVGARGAGISALILLAASRGEVRLPSRGLAPYAIAVGGFETVAIVSLHAALQEGSLAMVAVVSSLYPVTTLLLARLTLNERLVAHQKAGVGLALAAVVMIAGG